MPRLRRLTHVGEGGQSIRVSDDSRRPRVFGIGFHKTGTTSLAAALQTLGYRAVHGAGPVRRVLGHAEMMRRLRARDFETIWRVAEAFDAYADNPWFSLFREADARFPGSRFVLTRRDPNRWMRSVVNHFGGSSSELRQWVYGVGDPRGNEARFMERYRNHEAAVLAHFADRPADLLVMDVEQGHGWTELCRFLGRPAPAGPFPHENRRTRRLQVTRVGRWLGKAIGSARRRLE